MPGAVRTEKPRQPFKFEPSAFDRVQHPSFFVNQTVELLKRQSMINETTA